MTLPSHLSALSCCCPAKKMSKGGSRGNMISPPPPQGSKTVICPSPTISFFNIRCMALHDGNARFLRTVCHIPNVIYQPPPPPTSFGPLQNIPLDSSLEMRPRRRHFTPVSNFVLDCTIPNQYWPVLKRGLACRRLVARRVHWVQWHHLWVSLHPLALRFAPSVLKV